MKRTGLVAWWYDNNLSKRQGLVAAVLVGLAIRSVNVLTGSIGGEVNITNEISEDTCDVASFSEAHAQSSAHHCSSGCHGSFHEHTIGRIRI